MIETLREKQTIAELIGHESKLIRVTGVVADSSCVPK